MHSEIKNKLCIKVYGLNISFQSKKFLKMKGFKVIYEKNINLSEYTNLASGSSRVSKFSQRVEIILSYLLGYFLKIS